MIERYKKNIVALLLVAQMAPALTVASTVFAATLFSPHEASALTQADCDRQNGAGKTELVAPAQEDGQGEAYCAPIGVSVTSVSDKQRQENTPPVGTNCTLNPIYFDFGNCMDAFLSALGSLFLSLGAAILQLTGWIFDWMVRYIVVEFGQLMRDLGILDAITAGWTVLRDFANILIIGFFVFIAISIVLGLTEFGQKRLIANVLVIAVLMNFSLLFTKLIIDGSNFVAYQVYAQIASSNGQTTGQFNISERFLAPMKIQSVWSTYGLVRDVSIAQKSGAAAFAYGLVGGIMLLGVAAVLLYGCFLIATRGVLFIFLMLTAPLAFATYLVPTLSKGEYGWDSWWKMLVNNAAFGPLLMILLAVSLSILNAAGSKATTPIGDILSNPSTVATGAGTTILVYIIGIGLIFASLKLASGFASSIGGGYGLATGLSKLVGLGPISGAAALAGRGLRNRFGGRAAFKSLQLEDSIEEQRRNVRLAKPEDKYKENQVLMNLLKQKGAADKTAKREFNFENTALGKALIKSGMPALAGDTKGGFAEPRKKAAEEAAKAGSSAVVSNKQAEEIARTTMDRQQEAEKRQLEEQKSTNEQLIKATQSVAENIKHEQGWHAQRDEAFKAAATATQAKTSADDDHKAGKISDSKREEIMREQEQKITEANKKIREANVRMQSIHDEHLEAPHIKMAEQKVKDASERLRQLEIEHKAGVKDLKGKVVEASINDAASILAGINHADPYTTAQMGVKLRASNKDSRIKDQLRVLRSMDDDGGTRSADAGPKTS